MYNKCKFLKQCFDKKFKCKRDNTTIMLSKCINCHFKDINTIKEYKYTKTNKSVLKRVKMPLNKVSKKQVKLEKDRYSIFTNDLTKCIEDKTHQGHIDKHECIYGSNRHNSIKYGLVVPLCRTCHEDKNIIEKWLFTAQEEFIKRYGYDEFMKVFKINYIEKRANKKRPTRLSKS